MGLAIVEQAFEFWFNPEIERRQAAGTLPDGFAVWAGQWLQDAEGAQIVRLNDEVRGEATVISQRPVEKGETVLRSDLAELQRFELDASELDYGHVTMFQTEPGRWFVSFNFLRGRAQARDIVDRAEEFTAAAAFSISRGHAAPALDNLFSAYELLAKAYLLMHMSPATKSRKHGSIHSAINAELKFGNVPTRFVQLLNYLSNGRDSARYTTGKPVIVPDDALQISNTTIQWLRANWRSLADDVEEARTDSSAGGEAP